MRNVLSVLGLLLVLTACPGPTPGVSVPPDLVWVTQGSSATFTLSGSGGASGPVSVTGLPSGVTAEGATLSGSSVTVRLAADPSAPQGPADATVGVGTASATLHLFVRGPAGSLDTTFNATGLNLLPFGSDYASAHDLQPGPDGSVYLAGLTSTGPGSGGTPQAFVARFTAAGVLDGTFGVGGYALLALGDSQEQADAVRVLPGGQVLVLGSTFPGAGLSPGHWFLERLNANGTPDSAFGTAGRLNLRQDFPLPGPLAALGNLGDPALTVTADGRYVIVGQAQATGFGNYAVAQAVHPDGTMDTPVVLPPRGGSTTPYAGGLFAALTDPTTGDILAAGTNNSQAKLAVARLTPGLAPVTTGSWGEGGVVEPPAGATLMAFAHGLALDPSGKIVVAGGSTNAGRFQAAVTRLLPSGALDAGFGAGGLFTLDPDAGQFAAAAATDTEVLAAGNGIPSDAPSGHQSDLLLVRLTPAGLLDGNFGTGGKVFTDLQANSRDTVNALIAFPDQRVTVAGSSLSGSVLKVVLARYWN